ncbi:dTDP-D-glucose 4,6-dehydratase isoform 3-T3 [Pholidichthys leucotaenia]
MPANLTCMFLGCGRKPEKSRSKPTQVRGEHANSTQITVGRGLGSNPGSTRKGGSHLVCSLVHRHPEWRIINLDSLDYCCSPRSLESVEERTNYTFIKGDVCNARLMKYIFNSENIDVIFHLAAKTHVESSFEFPSSYQRVNVDGTRVLLAAAHQSQHQPQRFIYISTDEVYGPGLDEVIPRFITLLQMNKKCTIQGTLPKSRHFLFISDAIKAFLLVLEKGILGEIYNVGSPSEIPIVQLARELIRMVKNIPTPEVNDWLEYVPDRPRVDLRYPIKCEKLEQLGWSAEVPWAEGIRHTVKWYQDNCDFWSVNECGPTTNEKKA